jgi:hypothetical protein
MAYSHIKIIRIVEDSDSEGKPRIRAQFEDYKPRTGFINLKKADSAHINALKKIVGGSAMIGLREGMMNGQTFYQFLPDEEIIPIHQPQPIASTIVELPPVDDKPKPDLKTMMANR